MGCVLKPGPAMPHAGSDAPLRAPLTSDRLYAPLRGRAQVRQLDALTSKLASSVLFDREREDWLERAAAWDAQAAAERQAWASPPAAPSAPPPPPAPTYLAEYSRGARSTCRRCLRLIGVGELRHGVQLSLIHI